MRVESKHHFPTFQQCLARTHFGGCWHEKCGCQRSRRLKILATILRAVLWHCRTCNHLFPPTSQAATALAILLFGRTENSATAIFIASFERVRNKVMDRQYFINISLGTFAQLSFWTTFFLSCNVTLQGPLLNLMVNFSSSESPVQTFVPHYNVWQGCSRTMSPNKNNNQRLGK